MSGIDESVICRVENYDAEQYCRSQQNQGLFKRSLNQKVFLLRKVGHI